jgi:hypothetical protein
MTIGIEPAAGAPELQNLSSSWLEAAVAGALIGLIGALVFIGISALVHSIAEDRRSREALARCALAGGVSPGEIGAAASEPAAILPTDSSALPS